MMSYTSSTDKDIGAVVHPTDLKAPNDVAFVHALKIALARQAKFYILHNQSPMPDHVEWSAFPGVREMLTDWKLLESESTRADVAKKLGIHVAKVEVHGRDTAKDIVHFLESHDSDLLVLATHGREGLSRWLHGSVAEPIARQANVNALFMREGSRGFVDPKNGNIHLRRILIPIDHKPRPEAAVNAAKQLSRWLHSDTDIRLLHVGDYANMPVLSHLPSGSELSVKDGNVVDEILDAAGDWNADLIAMSTAGHQGFLDALRGSTSERVLRQAPCPVLVVPTE